MSQTRSKHVLNVSQISLKHLWHTYQPRLKYGPDHIPTMSQPCSEHVPTMSQARPNYISLLPIPYGVLHTLALDAGVFTRYRTCSPTITRHSSDAFFGIGSERQESYRQEQKRQQQQEQRRGLADYTGPWVLWLHRSRPWQNCCFRHRRAVWARSFPWSVRLCTLRLTG